MTPPVVPDAELSPLTTFTAPPTPPLFNVVLPPNNHSPLDTDEDVPTLTVTEPVVDPGPDPTTTLPLVPLLPALPLLNSTLPESPPNAVPLSIVTPPDDPVNDVPDRNNTAPLDAPDDAPPDATTTEPEPVPEAALLVPLLSTTLPPAPADDPLAMTTLPDEPVPDAVPELSTITPLFTFAVAPL